ncbi:pyridoxamine 5'-phosphate oxidase family protein [Nesterenkonia marinintestina]|uniref:pyridoxamine 5'-phosphate oxidase family protein n=1 Tax=Nesterenkonia marinintestina TaxID=2979865 RepID=UPI0021C0B1C8|nr:pyridoxamine 5'-phosphate oxidase family protein [Nesterenkonia sp. GX14115]
MTETKSPAELIELLDDIGTCMFTTVDSEGRLVSRPMGIAHVDEDHRLWFFTRVESEKVDDVVGEGRVNLAFVDDKTWVSVAGTASVSTDEQKKSELWQLGAKAYFADGPEDSDAALICVEPDSAQYWEGPGSAAALVKMAAAAVSDDRPTMGDQGRVDL